MVFAIVACGFVPRCALEDDNGVHVRLEKISDLIKQSHLGIHDISRIELDLRSGFPRFNMPLELGMFIGAARFGGVAHRGKNILILDSEQYRYQTFISDIADHDIRAHGSDARRLITHVRNWLNTTSSAHTISGGRAIHSRYVRFTKALPALCKRLSLRPDELTYADYHACASVWLYERTQAPRAHG
jgi:hypothetical protein